MIKVWIKYISVRFFIILVLLCPLERTAAAGVMMDDPMNIGFAIGGEDEGNLDLCPGGSSVIGMFLNLWKKGDYESMYKLIDDDSKKDYSVEDAKFDFRILPYIAYTISSVRKAGDNYEFILSSGDWKDNDKKLTKMIINGKTLKIIMPSRNSPFKSSVESYF
ncbi:MAG: hypothetical protein P9L90_06235 [Candidatus Aadella gelida]|nr:hypothetical protein [Candidatus Aadella gelida]